MWRVPRVSTYLSAASMKQKTIRGPVDTSLLEAVALRTDLTYCELDARGVRKQDVIQVRHGVERNMPQPWSKLACSERRL